MKDVYRNLSQVIRDSARIALSSTLSLLQGVVVICVALLVGLALLGPVLIVGLIGLIRRKKNENSS